MNEKIKILYLSERDVLATGMLEPAQCNCTIERTIRLVGKGDFLLGGGDNSVHGLSVAYPQSSDIQGMPLAAPDYRYMAMVGYVGGDARVCGAKIYGSNTENTCIGIPRSNHIILLNDVKTGIPLSLMNGTQISSMRTGAVSAIGAKYAASPNAKKLLLVGAGSINRSALSCLLEACPSIDTVYVYDTDKAKTEQFICQMQTPAAKLISVDNDMDVAQECDIIHFAFSAIPPLGHVHTELIKPGALLIFACVLDYDARLLDKCSVVIDCMDMHKHWYRFDPEMNIASYKMFDRIKAGTYREEDVIELGKLVSGEQAPPDDKPVIMMLNGLPTWDIAVAHSVYQEAQSRGIGTMLDY